MALTRKFLSALGIEADKVDEIIDAHSQTVNALKEERDKFKAQAVDSEELKKTKAELEKVQTELKEVKDSKSATDSELQKKYDDLKSEYDKYKADADAKETKAKKTNAYKKLLKDAGISEKRLDSVLKVSADVIDKIEFDDEGNVKDTETLNKQIDEEWADFKTTKQQAGANVSNPPTNTTGGAKTKSRAAEIAEKYHSDLYGESKKED